MHATNIRNPKSAKLHQMRLKSQKTKYTKKNEHLGKPKDALEAKSFLKKISNKEHEVITSVCFTEKEKQTIISESTLVFFKRISSNEINYYLNNFSFLDNTINAFC